MQTLKIKKQAADERVVFSAGEETLELKQINPSPNSISRRSRLQAAEA